MGYWWGMSRQERCKWETNVVGKTAGYRVAVGRLPRFLKQCGVNWKGLGFCKAGVDKSREKLLCR